MKTKPPEGFLDKHGACLVLGCTPRTIENYVKRGWIPYYKFGTGVRARVFYKKEDLLASIERWRVEINSCTNANVG